MTADPNVRIERIAKRDGESVETARSKTVQREGEEREWFLRTYDIDILDESVYNLKVDTTTCDLECVIMKILSAIESTGSSDIRD